MKTRLLSFPLAALATFALTTIGSNARAANTPDSCSVPHFTVSASDLGEISTKSNNLSCINRQRSLAFFAKVARIQSGDANAVRSGQWTANGEQMAREAADIAVKNSLVKTGIDVLVAKVKYNEKVVQGESGKALTQAALSFASKATVFASKLFCANGPSCSTTTERVYSFTADTLKLASQLPSCLEGKPEKCADSIKSSSKIVDLILKYFEKPPTATELQQWATFTSDWLRGGSGLTKAIKSGDAASYVSASGDLIETTIKTYTGSYWRKDQDVTTGFNNLLEIIGNGTSTWTTCKSATMTLATLRPGQITSASADCVSKLNEYFNTRLAEIMSYSMVLFQASKEQYNASVIDGSRVVMGEVFRTGGWAPTFQAYGVVYNENSILSGSQDLKVAETIVKITSKYGVSHSGIAALHSNWYDGWSGDVLRTINATYFPMLNSEVDAIAKGQRDLKTYAGVRFEAESLAPTITLAAQPSPEWDTSRSFLLNAKSLGLNKGVSLQAMTPSGKLVASSAMVPMFDYKDGSSDWRFDVATDQNWKRLLDGSYLIRGVVVGMDGQGVNSPSLNLTIKRTALVSPTPVPPIPPTAQPVVPSPALSVNMLDFMPRDLTGGQNVKFVAQTNVKSKAVRLVFDQLQGGPSVELTNPSGNGIDWVLERPVTAAGSAANNYQRPIWAIATGIDGQVSTPNGPSAITVKPLAAAPIPTPTPPGGLPPGSKIVNIPNIPASIEQNGRLAFTVNTDKPAEKVVMVFQNPDAEAILTGSGISFTFDRPITAAGTRPWKLRVYANNNQVTDEHIAGTLTVRAAPGIGVDSVAMPLSPMPGASQTFGNKLDYKTSACHFLGYHTGVDYAPVAAGQSVFAIADGQVVKTGQIGKTANSLGSYVVVDHPQLGIRSYYLHVVPAVGVGTRVTANQKVAAIAATTAVGKHLHLEIQKTGFGIVDSNGKPKLFVGHGTTPIGNCGYVSRQADLSKGWLDPATFLKHPTVQAGTSQHQVDHEDVDSEDFPTLAEQKKRIDVIGLFLGELAKKNYKFPGSLDEQARAAGLIAGASLVRPQDNASRMEVALLAHRLLQKFAGPGLAVMPSNTFPIEEFDDGPDVNAMEYKRVVDALASIGIVSGVRDANGEARFFPTRKASATEVQAIVDRSLAKVGNLSSASPKIVNTTNIPASIEQNGRLTFTVNADKPAERVVMVFQNPDGEAPLTGSGTSFAFDRQITVPGTRPWKLRVYANNNQITDEHLTGNLVVKPAMVQAPPVPTPVVALLTGVQAQGSATLGALATFVFNGSGLTGNVKVTVNNCDQPQTQLLSPTQIRHQCVPRQAGPQSVGWKVDGNEPTVRVLGAVTVASPQPTAITPPQLVVPSHAPSVSMLDFMPRDLTAGQNVKFVAQTSVKSKAVRLVFDQLQGGSTVELTNPSGNGIDWMMERPVTAAGSAANNFQRPIWAIATGVDGQISTPNGPSAIIVKPQAAAPVPTPVTAPVPMPPQILPTPQPVPTPGIVPSAPSCGAGGIQMCGVDGQTYPNACTLIKLGVAKRGNGKC